LIYFLDPAKALGPEEYCNYLNSTLNYISAEELHKNFASTQLPKKRPQSNNIYIKMVTESIFPVS